MHLECLEERRLLAAGDLDPTFTAGAEIASRVGVAQMLSAPGGKIILLNDNESITRYRDTDLNVDNSFGVQGTATLGAEFDHVEDAIVLADGKILVCGYQGPAVRTIGTIVRLTADGHIDSTFGQNGVVSESPEGGFASIIEHVAEQADGKIVYFDDFNSVGLTKEVRRLNADGSVDSSFTPFLLDYTRTGPIASIQIQSTGKIILGGSFAPAGTSDHDTAYNLARLNSDGTLDTSFGDSNGYVRGVIGDVAAFRVLDDDRILIGGRRSGFAYLTRLDAGGHTDLTFGKKGTTALVFGGYGFDRAAIAITPAGQIIAAGTAVARFNFRGKFDVAFGRVFSNATAILPQTNGDILILAGGKIVRMQGSAGGPDGPIRLANGVLTIDGTDDGEAISAYQIDDEMLVQVFGSLAMGRMYGAADFATISDLNISAGGGRDRVYVITGVTIRTSVSGGDGNDWLYGGPEDDSLSGNAGADIIDGGEGNDRLAGNGGRDRITGGLGDDRIFGGASGDWLAGQGGNDSLYGEGGLDRLDGGIGADVVHGNAGDDLITAAEDVYNPEASDVVDSVFGDGGHDSAFADESDLLTSIENISDHRVD